MTTPDKKETPREESSAQIVQEIVEILNTSADNMRESARNIDEVASQLRRERWMMDQEQRFLDGPTL